MVIEIAVIILVLIVLIYILRTNTYQSVKYVATDGVRIRRSRGYVYVQPSNVRAYFKKEYNKIRTVDKLLNDVPLMQVALSNTIDSLYNQLPYIKQYLDNRAPTGDLLDQLQRILHVLAHTPPSPTEGYPRSIDLRPLDAVIDITNDPKFDTRTYIFSTRTLPDPTREPQNGGDINKPNTSRTNCPRTLEGMSSAASLVRRSQEVHYPF